MLCIDLLLKKYFIFKFRKVWYVAFSEGWRLIHAYYYKITFGWCTNNFMFRSSRRKNHLINITIWIGATHVNNFWLISATYNNHHHPQNYITGVPMAHSSPGVSVWIPSLGAPRRIFRHRFKVSAGLHAWFHRMLFRDAISICRERHRR